MATHEVPTTPIEDGPEHEHIPDAIEQLEVGAIPAVAAQAPADREREATRYVTIEAVARTMRQLRATRK